VEAETQKSSLGASEMLCMEASVDFSVLTAVTLTPRLTALTMQTAGSGDYRVRVGGTSGVADGTVVAMLSTTNAAFPSIPDQVIGSAFANPAAPRLVKITITAIAGQRARLRAYEILFT
jgi:hypothetical protein